MSADARIQLEGGTHETDRFLAGCSCYGGRRCRLHGPVSGQADEEAAPIFGITIPPGYRDWRLISVAHEEGNLNDFRAILGNDVAGKPFGKGSFHSRTAQSLPGWPGNMSRRRKTTKPLAVPNLSLPGPR